MKHYPVDVRYDAESSDADRYEGKRDDETDFHVVLPFFRGVVRLGQGYVESRIVLDEPKSFAKVNDVPLFLCRNYQSVEFSGHSIAKLRQVSLDAFYGQAHSTDQRDGDVRDVHG